MGNSSGRSGTPTMIIFPWVFKRKINGTISCFADTVFIIPSMVPIAAYKRSLLTINASAPKVLMASSFLFRDVLITVTFIPKALPNLTATWPSPPRPTTPRCFPGSSRLKVFMGL
ncbi:hypothetical protein MA16_Dca028678 [Dendrobium catenatum]|uniref:Uncharacterized protein n=1 Tax=Dendrobium catenatum TaxID=906689 RepID=A0A2I0VD64_9ASPA|nr:hypothetical protein MA16_Dca028678 [Dendrobium catenatum]